MPKAITDDIRWHIDFPSLRFKPPPLGGQISSLMFPVHCRDVARRQSRWLLVRTLCCQWTHADDPISRAYRLALPVPTGLGPVSGLSVLRTNPPAFSWWLFSCFCRKLGNLSNRLRCTSINSQPLHTPLEHTDARTYHPYG
jgi:hypothetical protein